MDSIFLDNGPKFENRSNPYEHRHSGKIMCANTWVEKMLTKNETTSKNLAAELAY